MIEQFDKIIDISVDLSSKTIIYPGDPLPEYGMFFSLANGEIANVGYIKHGIHHGTHVDVPCHFRDGDLTFEQMPMSHWIGPVLVVDVTAAEQCVKASDLADIPLHKHSRLLFKTKNSLDYYQRDEFFQNFIYLEKSACDKMVEAGVKTVGLDYITVDPHGSKDFAAHKTLLFNGICIIECINLKDVEPGEYYLMCLPQKLVGTDGAPARIVLLKPGFCV